MRLGLCANEFQQVVVVAGPLLLLIFGEDGIDIYNHLCFLYFTKN